jgi:hypothetical protein
MLFRMCVLLLIAVMPLHAQSNDGSTQLQLKALGWRSFPRPG